MVSDSIRYQGIVKIIVGGKEIEVKNTGTPELSYVICKALSGQSVVGRIPRYFDIQIRNNDRYVSLLNKNIPFTGKTYSTNLESTSEEMNELVLIATVLYGDKETPYVDSESDIRFVIKSELGYVLAYVTELEEEVQVEDESVASLADIFNRISQGLDCFIEWHMKIMNFEKAKESYESIIKEKDDEINKLKQDKT